MKFTNALDNKDNSEKLRKALVEWVLGTDGEDGATCNVLGTIPWTNEMESVIPWREFDEKIDEAIGSREDWAQKVYDLVNSLETGLRADFDDFISEKVARIYGVYATMIDALNKKSNKKCVLMKFVGLDFTGCCQYNVVMEFNADTYLDAINKMWRYIQFEKGLSTEWKFNNMADALYTFDSVSINNEFSAQLIK